MKSWKSRGLAWTLCLAVGLAGCGEDMGGNTNNNNNPGNNSGMGDMDLDSAGGDGADNHNNNPMPGQCFDRDGDGFFGGANCMLPADQLDCDDNDPDTNPGAPEICGNRKDNNCNGLIDESCPCQPGALRLCTSLPGRDPQSLQSESVYCKPGVQRCVSGQWASECEGERGPREEQCNRMDDDCDGVADNGLREPITGQCYADLPPDFMPPVEDCGPTGEGNGLDDNGDGQIDEGCSCALPADAPNSAGPRVNQPCYGGLPSTLGVGQCRGGRRDCGADGTWGTCRDQVLPEPEICGDGIDNDCDGVVDNGCPICVPTNGGVEICDGIDNNCDGQIDEGVRNACGGCGPVSPTEICGNGMDDNCDGQVDEGCPCTAQQQECYIGPPESAGVGICNKGVQTCHGESWGPCVGSVQPGIEICGDGIDNNCDGQIDENCGCPDGATRPCGSDTGVCMRGVQTCSGGDWGACEGGMGPTEPGVEMTCNGLDDNCNGLIDEGLLNACGKCNEPCYLQPVNPTAAGELDGGAQVVPANDPENPTGRAGVSLSKDSTFLPYLWVVNNNQHSVSKFNTQTGLEEARYWVGLQASRTALDLQGNAYVTGRNDGRVTKIFAREEDCVDRNGDGIIQTSRRDVNGNVALVNNQANPLADECVAFSQVINPNFPSARGVTTDSSGTVWIGYSAQNGGIQSLDPFTLQIGPTYPTINIPVFAPDAQGVLVATGATATYPNQSLGQVYGLVADSRGYVYAVSLNFDGIARFNTMTRQWDMMIRGFDCRLYGVTVDASDRIWSGCTNTTGGMVMYDPTQNGVFRVGFPANPAPSQGATAPVIFQRLTSATTTGAQQCPSCRSGMRITALTTEPATGDIWTALFTQRFVGRLRVAPNLADSTWQYISVPQAGTGMRGIGFDPTGFAWYLDPDQRPIFKLDPNTASVVGSFDVGSGGHYGYSDFSGSLLFSFTAPRGTWSYRFDTQFANAQVSSLEWSATVYPDTAIGARVRVVDPTTGAPLSEWRPAPGAGNQPNYFDYPAGQAMSSINLAAMGGVMVGQAFQVEILMTTTDRDVRPFLHDIRLGWARP
jgi:streptogramin lyase